MPENGQKSFYKWVIDGGMARRVRSVLIALLVVGMSLTAGAGVVSAQESGDDCVPGDDDGEMCEDLDVPPTDPDDDGQHEDIDGSGTANIFDVAALLDLVGSPTVDPANSEYNFDYNEDGDVDIFDVAALLDDVSAGS